MRRAVARLARKAKPAATGAFVKRNHASRGQVRYGGFVLVSPRPRRSRFAGFAAALSLGVTLVGCTPSIGDACSYATECSARGDRVCDTTQPGGYCTVANCGRGTCPEGSVCVLFGAREPGCATNDRDTQRLGKAYCMASCGSSGDCRGGYACASPRSEPWAAALLDDDANATVCLALATVSAPDAAVADAGAPVCAPAGPSVPAIDAPVRREDAAAP
jgi:hypothetical protein